MNRGTTILILLVVLAAMGLVMFSHIGGKNNETQVTPATMNQQPGATNQGGFANPLQAPQGDGGGLRPIEPPISGRSPATAPAPGRDGAPQPVRLTPATDGKPPQPITAPEQQATGAANSVSPEAAIPAPPPGTPETASSRPAQGDEGLLPPGAPVQIADLAASKADNVQQAAPAQPPATSPPAGKPAGGAPGLTPWTTPPQTTASLPAKTQSKPQTAPGSHSLRNITLSFADKGMVLHIEADSSFTVNTFMLTGPERMVIDLPGSWKEMRKPGLPQNTLIKNVRLGQQPAGPRLVLDLVGPLKSHRVERSGNTARIYIN